MTDILVIELEPTHYKTDLWNCVNTSKRYNVKILYTEKKNWAPDAGHDFKTLPDMNHEIIVHNGRGFFDIFRSLAFVINYLIKKAPKLVYVVGYSKPVSAIVIFLLTLLRQPFVVFVDKFNIYKPPSDFLRFKYIIREILRRFVFQNSLAVLTCGDVGVKTAIAAGCSFEKLVAFPYYVSLERLLSDKPKNIPKQCVRDLRTTCTILFFSGRMIERKGLVTLLQALESIVDDKEWVLWIEGDGPNLASYQSTAMSLGISSRCRWLGFQQYYNHSWLLRNSDVVIVPSSQDNWGIVVGEAIILQKVVVSTFDTGSAKEMLGGYSKGHYFRTGDVCDLTLTLRKVMRDEFLLIDRLESADRLGSSVSPREIIESIILKF